MAFVDSFLKQLATGDSIHDWQHASKIFVSDSYRLAPKYGFLFFVKILISDQGSTYSQTQTSDVVLIGATAKSANLPKYTFETKTHNAYNRPNIVQGKLKYEPITLKFHDDSAGLVRAFWYDYLSYYYRDTDYAEEVYRSPHKYQSRQRDGWGYNVKPDRLAPGVYNSPANYNYIKSISIFSMSQKTYAEYQLINPIISSFQHGEHNMSEGGSTLENTMTLQYETVHYKKGYVTENTLGEMFARYDRSSSPLTALGGGTRSLFGPGGFVSALGEIGQNLADGNFLAAALAATRANENFKNVDIGDLAKTEALQAITNMVQDASNPFSGISVPAGISAVALAAAYQQSQASNNQQGPSSTSNKPAGSSTPTGQSNLVDTTPSQNTQASSNGSTVSQPTNTIPTTPVASFPPVDYGVGGTGSYNNPYVVPAANTTANTTTSNSSGAVGSTLTTINDTNVVGNK